MSAPEDRRRQQLVGAVSLAVAGIVLLALALFGHREVSGWRWVQGIVGAAVLVVGAVRAARLRRGD